MLQIISVISVAYNVLVYTNEKNIHNTVTNKLNDFVMQH